MVGAKRMQSVTESKDQGEQSTPLNRKTQKWTRIEVVGAGAAVCLCVCMCVFYKEEMCMSCVLLSRDTGARMGIFLHLFSFYFHFFFVYDDTSVASSSSSFVSG